MARLVYACRFEVPGTDAEAGIVAPAYEAWIHDHYQRSRTANIQLNLGSGSFTGHLPDQHRLTIERHEADAVARVLRWVFPGDHGLLWRNDVRMAQVEDSCVVEHRIHLESAEYLVAPASFSVGAPRVVRGICETQIVQVGKMRLRAVPYPLETKGVDDFVSLLSAEDRRLPIVLTSPFANGDNSDVDANTLASHLAGVAVVTRAGDPETTRALSDRIGRLGCYGGAVRIYWPGFSTDDELGRHPLILSTRIASLGAVRATRSIERSIFSVAAFRFIPDARVDGIVAAAEFAQRASRAAAAREQGDATWEQYALELAGNVDRLDALNRELLAENANLRANQEVLFAWAEDENPDENANAASPIDRSPRSVAEAVEFAKQDFSDLEFLESSTSAAADSPFKRPAEVYQALSQMNVIAGVWKRNQGNGDLRQMLIQGGLGKRVSNFISPTTLGKWGDEYHFLYEGERRLFSWHVTLGAGSADTCASVHFFPDAPAGKLIIGHVGRHLSNTST
jgi:hypothetical protein